MLVQIGRILFAIGVVVSVALAAKPPKWEAVHEAATELAPHIAKGTRVEVHAESGGAIDDKKAATLEADLRRALAMEGVQVQSPAPEDADAPPPQDPPPQVQARDVGNGVVELALLPHPASDAAATVKLELDRSWPSTSPLWGLFAALAALGVALWRVGAMQAAKQAVADGTDSQDNPFTLLAAVLEPARALGKDIASLTDAQILKRTDGLLETYLLPLANGRQRVIDRLGMKAGSEILVTVAFGERMLNRVWSAAADGHLDEARGCFPEALTALEEAQRLAKQATEASAGGPSGAPVAVTEAGSA